MSKSILQKKRILTKSGGGSSLSTPVSVANGGTGLTSYAIGDIIYASGATTLSKLAIGTANQQLRVNAGATALEYFTPSSSGLTIGTTPIASGADTRVLFQDGSVLGQNANYYFNKTTGELRAGTFISFGVTAATTINIKSNSNNAISIHTDPGYTPTVGNSGIGIGGRAINVGANALGIGFETVASATGSLALGRGATTTYQSMVIGQASATNNNQFILAGAWTSSVGVNNVYVGNGVTNASPTSVSIQPTGGLGSNVAGASLTIAGGKGTGSATTGGDIIFQTSDAEASSSTLQTLTTKYTIKKNGVQDYPTTVTAGGTTGDQTINKVSGTVNFAAGATAITVTNSLVSTTSIVFAVVRTNDTTATIKNVVPGSGSFVITLTAAATAETSVGFFTINS
jgi:hypothetical protein